MEIADSPDRTSSEVDRLRAAFDTERARLKRRMAGRERRAAARGILDGVLSQLRPGDVALDCGANVGDITCPLAETGATIFAFEPDPVAFAALQTRTDTLPNVHAINAAVAVQAGTATLHRTRAFADDPLASTVSSTLLSGKRDSDARGANDIDVPVLSLPGLLRDLTAGRIPAALPATARKPWRVTLLKLDVEGEELNLLPALHDANLLEPIGCTLVETHQRKFPDRRRDFLRMRRRIGAQYPTSKVNLDWI